METVIHFVDEYKIIEYKKTNIYVIENIVDDDFCNKIINFIDNSNEMLKSESGINDQLLNCHYLYLSKYIEQHRPYDFMIYEVVRNIFLIITKLNKNFRVQGDTVYHLRKIHGPTLLHTDEVRANDSNYIYNQIRNIALVIGLNDDYDGGEFFFPNHEVKHKLKKGSVILFPPFWTHPHEILGLGNDQYRYTVTTWGTEDIVSTNNLPL
jgi:hypothetical protein